VKLLDFGIAKLIEDDEQTQTVHAALTPAYAAPEQYTGAAVTTATDVYALGLLLGELVTGERLTGGSARTPSSQTGGKRLPPRLDHVRLRGELGNIVRKAIEQEPEHRYDSAGALADDVARLRTGQPVSAHPPSRAYRLRKFISRHRGGFAVTAAFLVAIVAALSIALWQTHVAHQQARRAEAIRDFVVDILEQTAPDGPAATRPDVPTLVYTAASSLPNALREEPLARTELLYTLGNVLRDMDDFEHSESLLRAAEQDASGFPQTSPARIETEIGLSRTLLRRGDFAGAQARIDPLLALPPRDLPPDTSHAELLKIAASIAGSEGKPDLALSYGRQMLAAYRADCANGRNCDDLAYATSDMADTLFETGHVAEALPLADEALRRKLDQHASQMSLALTVQWQSQIALYRGDFDTAEAKARKADALVASLGNSLKSKPLDPVAQLADVLLAKGEASQAEATLRSLMSEQRKRKSSDCALSWSEMALSRAQLMQGLAHAAAESSAKAIVDAHSCRRASSRDAHVALAELAHGRALAAAGDHDGAAADYVQAMKMAASVHHNEPPHWPLYLAQSMRLAETLGLHADAIRHARDLIRTLDQAQALPAHPWRAQALALIGATP
jgi:serine/threonine-protein kinase